MTPSSLTTRCAHCQTVFRVTTVQLQAHAGQVRCGRCMQVFDALAALAPEPAPLEAAPAALPEQSEATIEGATEPAIISEPQIPPADEYLEPLPAPSPITDSGPDTVVEAAASQPALLDEPAVNAEMLPATEVLPASTPEEVDQDADNPFTQGRAESPAWPQRRLRVAAALLTVVLAAQAVFFYRSEVAARLPLAKQALNWVCAQAGCRVTLPQRPQSILIEASDLQVIDPANPNRIQLTATLRNHAGHDVAYPALDLVLTNVNDHTLARRIFLPADYLGAGRDIGAGIAANAEMTVRLALETGSLGAAGFRLAVLAAPAI